MAVTIGRASRSAIHIDKTQMRALEHALRGVKGLANREQAIINVMKKATKDLEEDMGNSAPVDTGRLSDSFRTRKLLKTPPGVVGVRVGAVSDNKLAGWRAHFTELGTTHHSAQPFIGKAIGRNLPKILRDLRIDLQLLLTKLVN